ncbi:MAG: exodeoxyribonuclease VII large subunit, partial [Bacteroidales bacterium]|nr:exodeoxyribonuclease VII large subunit [Bacteroidales bacterium]
MRVQPQYSPLYGLSLIISDIDPLFTVGEMELARQRTIERLQKEGLMEMNSLLPLPLLPSRIAIVSSPTAAGYADFMNHLQENQLGVNFLTELFVAPMQGDEAPDGIIAALERIAQRQEEFDLVVLIRGGGAVTDLIPFDNYDLAVNIANFPLPVITGVGHEIDYHICDMVAHTGLKTPTAV